MNIMFTFWKKSLFPFCFMFFSVGNDDVFGGQTIPVLKRYCKIIRGYIQTTK